MCPVENIKNAKDIVCWDATRVQLTHDVPPATDYIHANWVKFDNFDRVYILTQAPLQNTIGDFWRMVLQCQSPSIVNLTQEVENENQKCVLYWPQHAGSFNSYGKIFVSTKRMEQLLTKLRAQRANAIPTDSLYAFVAYSVIDYIRTKLLINSLLVWKIALGAKYPNEMIDPPLVLCESERLISKFTFHIGLITGA
ncbi:Protein-tyrosine phosphatase [Teladorsagia circumcincta]|uniref:Protein-tyrosine phosphatase n=1 Tax=Teladorsagia circumcincta TaxID=45464 RepID=A0A2G9TX73_TELCI|nr:Protein-tyrosine phosphatase [Teladorsagia circumcincta]